MKPLAIVHTESSCGWGGQEIRVLEESRGMQERGHRVTLLCPPEATIYGRARERGIEAVALPIRRKSVAGVLALRQWLRDHRPDVVNTHSSTDSWLAALACASLRSAPPIVRTRHISAPIPNNAASRWLYRHAARHVVTTGEKLRRSLIDELGVPGERVTSVPTGIDTERFTPGDKLAARRLVGLEPDARWIGIVATLRSWKGHLYLLDALAAIERPDVRLVIVGEGPMRENIEKRIAELGIAERVRMVGEQRQPENWLRALEVFSLPSYANEGVPQALMQAMLTGLPIVTTPVGSILEAVEDGLSALVVPPQNANALRHALLRLIDDPSFASRIGRGARERAQQEFGFARMIERMERAFDLAQRGGPTTD